MKTFQELLKELNACQEARRWAKKMTIEEIIDKCHRGDWLLWLAVKIKINERKFFLVKGHCANTVRHLMTDKRSIAAVDTTIAYGEKKISKKELNKVAKEANDAVTHAIYTSEGNPYPYETAYGAASHLFTSVAITSAYASAYSVKPNDFFTAKRKNQLETANICKKYMGKEIIRKVNKLLKMNE